MEVYVFCLHSALLVLHQRLDIQLLIYQNCGNPITSVCYLFNFFIFIFLLQFFHGTAPKPSLSQIHQAIFGFNDDQAQSETVRCAHQLVSSVAFGFLGVRQTLQTHTVDVLVCLLAGRAVEVARCHLQVW